VALATTPAARLARLLDEGGGLGVDETTLPVRIGASPSTLRGLIVSMGDAIASIAGRIYARSALLALADRIGQLVDDHHRAHPLDMGLSIQGIRGAVAAPTAAVDLIVAEAVGAGRIEIDGALVRRRGWRPSLTPAEDVLRDRLESLVRDAGREPPSVSELTATLGDVVPALLRILERRGVVVPVEPDRYYAAPVLEQMIEQLRTLMNAGRQYSPAELREFLGVSRKYLIPLLEYCDRMGITDRRVAGRVLGGTPFANKSARNGDIRS
jgi:selenocysteine-specific elongation factor